MNFNNDFSIVEVDAEIQAQMDKIWDLWDKKRKWK